MQPHTKKKEHRYTEGDGTRLCQMAGVQKNQYPPPPPPRPPFVKTQKEDPFPGTGSSSAFFPNVFVFFFAWHSNEILYIYMYSFIYQSQGKLVWGERKNKVM